MEAINKYLIQAGYAWIIDSGKTPYINVDINVKDVDVPREYASGEIITLNISANAAKELVINKHGISFSAMFAGSARDIYVPISSVRAILAKETMAIIPLPEMESADKNVQPEDNLEDKKSIFKVVK